MAHNPDDALRLAEAVRDACDEPDILALFLGLELPPRDIPELAKVLHFQHKTIHAKIAPAIRILKMALGGDITAEDLVALVQAGLARRRAGLTPPPPPPPDPLPELPPPPRRDRVPLSGQESFDFDHDLDLDGDLEPPPPPPPAPRGTQRR